MDCLCLWFLEKTTPGSRAWKWKCGSGSRVLMQTQTVKNNQHQEVAVRAYQIWEAAGRPAGCELQHWLQAERDLGVSQIGKQPNRINEAPSKAPAESKDRESREAGKQQPSRMTAQPRGARQPLDVAA